MLSHDRLGDHHHGRLPRRRAPRDYDALESLSGPTSGTSWSTADIYVYWDFATREILYVGLASDLAVRFGQHNRFKGCPDRSCKRVQIDAHFAAENEFLGFTVFSLSSLTQPSGARWNRAIDLKDRELIELQAAFSAEALNDIRTLEGRLIAAHEARTGVIPPWNRDPGRKPSGKISPADATLAAVTGRFDCLLQSRRTIRQLAADGEASIFEEHLHGARLLAVSAVVLSQHGFRNDLLRTILAQTFSFFPGDLLLASDYLDHRNSLTMGPVLDPPA